VPRLRRSDCSTPGIRRRRAGRGFVYVDADGARIDDPDMLARIRALAIPPAWDDVWICPWPNGHLQATGLDARGRRQYRYHDVWRQRRDAEKFDHMLQFADALPMLRAQIDEHLALDDLSQERVLACAARLLDLGFFRIGTEGYVEENETFGLATMRKSHVSLDPDGVIRFDFPSKSGKRRIQSVVDEAVYEVVAELKKRRGGGRELLAWHDDNGRWVDVRSPDINRYLKDVTGDDVTAKDFRTWNATVLAAVALAVSSRLRSESGKKRAVAHAMKEVAHYLGNTPAVARKSYVDPRVVDRYLEGRTIADALHALGEDGTFGRPSTQGAIEDAVLDLLREDLAAAA
jgi:DNA topoisomerase IB